MISAKSGPRSRLNEFGSERKMIRLFAVFLAISAFALDHAIGSLQDPTPEIKEVHKTIQGSNDLALKLLRKLGQPRNENRPRNVFFSPTSISLALGMVFLGSRGKTAAQIADAFGWEMEDFEEVHATFRDLHEALHGTDTSRGELRLANRLWGHNEFELLEEFTRGTRSFYHSEIAQADFVNSFEDARSEINAWVNGHTQGSIKDFIPSGVITALTKLVLVNAVYFKGVWKKEFSEEKTFHAPFFVPVPHEFKIEVEMMSRTMMQNYFYDAENQCAILELPYSGNNLAMVIILPDRHDGITELERGLDTEKLDQWLTSMKNTTVQVSIPKFHLSQQFELNSVLSELGLTDLFDAKKADLSGITMEKGLFVSNVIHKAHVDVNERGTEAAAATGVTMMRRSIEMHEEFIADHPFIFFIHHMHSRAVLFLGKVMQPNQIGEAVNTQTYKPISDEL